MEDGGGKTGINLGKSVEESKCVIVGLEAGKCVDVAGEGNNASVGTFLCNGLCKREVVHHILVCTVNRGTADTVVGMILKKIFPRSVNVGGGVSLIGGIASHNPMMIMQGLMSLWGGLSTFFENAKERAERLKKEAEEARKAMQEESANYKTL